MRKAAVKAGLIPDDQPGHSRVSFVTEGEASLHFAIENGVLSQATQVRSVSWCYEIIDHLNYQLIKGEGIVIVDAGGGTIDISTYRRDDKRIFEEIAVPQCKTSKPKFNIMLIVRFW